MVRTVAGILVLGFAALPAGAQPTISFEETAVVTRGLTPGGSVVWFGVAREYGSWPRRVVRRDFTATDTDRDGRDVIDLGRAIPRQSIWVVVDVATGTFACATPPGYPLREVTYEPGDLPADPGGEVRRLRRVRSFFEVLVVRPGLGGWGLSVGDGGANDSDGQNDGKIELALSSLRPLGARAETLPQLQPGDVVVLVDPGQMDVTALRFGSLRP